MNPIRDVARIIFTWDNLLIPLSSPRETLVKPIKVINIIIIILFKKVSGIEKTYDSPELIWIVPSPNDVVTPKTVVRIAIISIEIARGLFSETFWPRRELTLKGRFLL